MPRSVLPLLWLLLSTCLAADSTTSTSTSSSSSVPSCNLVKMVSLLDDPHAQACADASGFQFPPTGPITEAEMAKASQSADCTAFISKIQQLTPKECVVGTVSVHANIVKPFVAAGGEVRTTPSSSSGTSTTGGSSTSSGMGSSGSSSTSTTSTSSKSVDGPATASPAAVDASSSWPQGVSHPNETVHALQSGAIPTFSTMSNVVLMASSMVVSLGVLA